MDLWTSFLNFVSQIVTPTWNDLLQYMPLLILGLVGLSVMYLARVWTANMALNRPRIPQRVTEGPIPPGVHLPGPSVWPFVLPFAGMFVLLGLVLPLPGLPVNPILVGLGALLALVGILGWYRDAGREWRRMELGAHAGHLTSHAVVPALPAKEPPPGIHLPGPSPWPFFAPIALMFIFAGLIFGTLMFLAGIVMGAIAAIGWYRDAGHEYHQVEAGHPAEPRTRDPRKAFPMSVVKVYVGIAAVVILITLAPWLFSFLPAGGGAAVPSAGGGQTPTANPVISAVSIASFEQKEVVVAANVPLKLEFDNKQAGVPHNVGIYDTPARATEIFKGELITGPAKIVYDVPPLAPGSYYFQCDIHPNMNGTLAAK
jgi:plastocyanin